MIFKAFVEQGELGHIKIFWSSLYLKTDTPFSSFPINIDTRLGHNMWQRVLAEASKYEKSSWANPALVLVMHNLQLFISSWLLCTFI